MDVVASPVILSLAGVLVAGVAFANRRKPEWQRAMPAIMVIAIGQVVLGVFVLLAAQ